MNIAGPLAVMDASAPLTGEPEPPIRLSELIAALSYALDLTEGQTMGHSVRTCVMGMRIAGALGMLPEQQEHLYYALLLKDAGCSSNSSRLHNIIGTDDRKAKRALKTTDWTKLGWESLQYALDHVATGRPFLERMRALVEATANNRRFSRELVQIRCERGASIARKIGLSEATAEGIQQLDEHWDGQGYPDGLRGTEISLLSRIMNLAQTLDVFYTQHGPAAALDTIKARSKRWFDPALVTAALSLGANGGLWAGLHASEANELVIAMEPPRRVLQPTPDTLDNICLAFAEVIDAKSPFTFRHSNGVADAAVSIAKTLGLPETEIATIRRAALLHDIGKLSVSNTILDKPAKLDKAEWEVVRQHPYFTQQILSRVSCFARVTEIAASHHEKLDGTGYFRNLDARHLSTPARILAVADVYDALTARRPYRDALPLDTVFGIMKKDAPHALDMPCFEALQYSAVNLGESGAKP